MKLTKNLLFTAMISAAALLNAAEPEGANPAAEYQSDYKAPVELKGYANTVQLPAVFCSQLKKLAGKDAEVAWEIEMEPTAAGTFASAKFRTYDSAKKDVMYDMIGWKTPVKKEKTKLSGKCKVKIPENFARATIVLYNCNKNGSLRVSSITLTADEAAADKK